MRDYRLALAGTEVDTVSLDNLGLSGRTRRRLHIFLDELILREYYEHYKTVQHDNYDEVREAKIQVFLEWRERSRRDLDLVLKVFWPNIDANAPNALTIWPLPDARGKGRSSRASMRIGRALRRMFPILTDAEVDDLVDVVKSKLVDQQFSYHVSKEASAFKRAYTHSNADYQNLDTSWSKKHMSNSCMRYEFENFYAHPVEAYASGDFESHWLETPDGRIAARCVVAVSKAGAKIQPQPAPIYAVSEEAHDFLWAKLKEAKCLPVADSNWVGCLLVANYVNKSDSDEGMYAPYLDLDPRGANLVNDTLVIAGNGSIDCSNYGGILYEGDRYVCDDCGEGLSEDCRYSHYNSGDGYSYCESCYYERYTQCECCEDDEARDSMSEVRTSHSHNHGHSETWCESCTHSHAVICTDEELWSETDTQIRNDGEYVSQHDVDNEHFRCWLTNELHHNDDMVMLEEGEPAAIQSIEDHNLSFDRKYVLCDTTGVYKIAPQTLEQVITEVMTNA